MRLSKGGSSGEETTAHRAERAAANVKVAGRENPKALPAFCAPSLRGGSCPGPLDLPADPSPGHSRPGPGLGCSEGGACNV